MRDKHKAKSTHANKGVANPSREPIRLSSVNRKDKWTRGELEILARPELTDYQKAKKLQPRTDASVRVKRRRMGYQSKEVEFNRQFTKLGYVMVRRNGRYERRNRVVSEEKLGRKLKPEEVVHHINGIKDDDRPENLYVCADRAEHNKLHAETIHIVRHFMEQNKVKFEKGEYILC